MSETIVAIDGGPLTKARIRVVKYCCAQEVIDKGEATSRMSFQISSSELNNNLTFNQGVMLAESILKAAQKRSLEERNEKLAKLICEKMGWDSEFPVMTEHGNKSVAGVAEMMRDLVAEADAL